MLNQFEITFVVAAYICRVEPNSHNQEMMVSELVLTLNILNIYHNLDM